MAALSASDQLMLYEPHEYTVGGLPVVRAKFRTLEESPTIGVVQLVQGREGVITLLALGTQPDWAAHASPLVLALNSQRRLTEADFAELEPTTMSIVAAQEGQTLHELASGPRELPMLRRFNRVGADEPLEAGRLLRRVPLPIEPPPPSSASEDAGTQTLSDPFTPPGDPEEGLPDPFAPGGDW